MANEFDNALRAQIFSLPGLIEQLYNDLEPKVRAVLSTPEIFAVQKIVLTGCGDPHAAALATKHAFQQLTGLPVEVLEAIEVSRYYPAGQVGTAPGYPLVVAVSNSGTCARVSEAVERMVRLGACVLGVTEAKDSPVGRHSSAVLALDIPAFESAPGTRSYVADVMALLLLAIRIGEVRGRYTMEEAMAYRGELAGQGRALAGMLDDMDAAALQLARQWKEMQAFDFIGSGPDYGAAWYSHAKVFEAIGRPAMHVNTEEWLHLNFFIANPDAMATQTGGTVKARNYSRN